MTSFSMQIGLWMIGLTTKKLLPTALSLIYCILKIVQFEINCTVTDGDYKTCYCSLGKIHHWTFSCENCS